MIADVATGDHFEEVIFAGPGSEESIDALVVETSTLFDHRLCQARQRGEFAVLRQTILMDGLDIRRIDSFLESQSRMKRPRPTCCRRSLRR